MKFDSVSFGKAVRTSRVIDRDLDLKDVEKQTGVSIATLSRVENGAKPDVNTLAALCSWMNKTMESFFTRRGK